MKIMRLVIKDVAAAARVARRARARQSAVKRRRREQYFTWWLAAEALALLIGLGEGFTTADKPAPRG